MSEPVKYFADKEEKELIESIMKKLKLCSDADDHNRTAAIEDLRFLNGDQWDNTEKNRRSISGRPVLMINLLPKYVDQVIGEMRENRPSIKFRPVGNNADITMAKIREGIVRNIEYLSNAPAIYDHAAEMQVSCGYGAWRVLTRYAEENPFIQEIYLESVKNPFLVYIDPSCKDSVGTDANFGFIMEKMSRKDFEEKYPGYEAPDQNPQGGKGLAQELWYDKDTVTVAEYFCKDTESIEMHQLKDGRVVTKEDYDQIVEEWEAQQKAAVMKLSKAIPGELKPLGEMLEQGLEGQAQSAPMGMPAPQPPQGQMAAPGPQGMPPQPAPMGAQQGAPAPPQQAPQQQPQITPEMIENMPMPSPTKPRPEIEKTRKTDRTIIRQYILTSNNILDGGMKGNRIAGKFIPLVLVYGKERNIEGKRFIRSLIRDGKDPQKLINYWNTTAAETIALAPKTPWVGTAKQFANYEGDYASANTENFPFLKYNVDPECPNTPPMRQQPGQPPVALFEQIRRGEENLKAVIGMFNSDMGADGPERTGAAVRARQRPGDISTHVFLENLSRSVAYTGQIINEMIPEIYDTERDVRLRNSDDTESFVPVNTTAAGALRAAKEEPERYLGIDFNRILAAAKKYGPDAKFNELTIGKYDVIVTTGPSYSTQRQESAEALLRLTSTMPDQMKLAADLIVRNLDFKDADEMADRLRKTLPPDLVKPREGEPPPKPRPDPPQVQIQKMKLQNEQMKLQMSQMKLEIEKLKLVKETKKMESDDRNRMMDLMEAGKINPAEEQKAAMELQKMNMELQNADQKNQLSLAQQQQQMQHTEDKHRLGLATTQQKHEHGLTAAQEKHEQGLELAKQKAAQSSTED